MAGPMNPYDAPQMEPRGMSSTSKVLLAFGIGCGVLALLCCGVFGLGGFMMYRFASNTIIMEPDRIREIAQQIVEIEIPDALEPKMGMDMRVPFAGTPMLKGAAFVDADDKSFLMIGQANPEFGVQGDDVEFRFNQAMNDRSRRNRRDFKTIESEEFKTTINDDPARFDVSHVVNEDSDEEYWRVEGDFRGDGGEAILIFELNSSDFSKDQALDILKSMK